MDADTPRAHTVLTPSRARIGYAVALAAAAIQFFVFRHAAVDDAYISFRYARNFAHGHGLVFNPGDAPVEGYSNFLWTVLLAPWAAAGDPMPAARALGIASAVVSAWLVVFWMRRMVTPRAAVASALALWLLAASPAVAYWHLAGLETPLATALLLLALATTVASRRLPALLVAAAWMGVVLVRADGIAFAVAAALVHGVYALRGRSATAHGRAWLPVACAWGAYTLWRVTTYGDFIPNTVRAKMLGDQWALQPGLASLGSVLLAHPWLLLVPWAGWLLRRRAPVDGGVAAAHAAAARAAAASALSDRVPAGDRRLAIDTALAVIAMQCVIVFGAGGDWMPLHRMWVPVLPVAAVLVCAAFATRVPALLVAVAVVAPVVHWTGNGPFATLLHRENVAVGAALGRALANPPDRVLAIAAAGAAPFYSGLRSIDMSGLSDARIAALPPADRGSGLPIGHLKGDGADVVARRPDYLAFVLGRNQRPGLDAAEVQILFEPAFYAEYEPWEFMASRPPGRARLWRASAAQIRQLEFLAGLRPQHAVTGRERESGAGEDSDDGVGGGGDGSGGADNGSAFGMRLAIPDRLRFVVFRRGAATGAAVANDPFRRACAAVDSSLRSGDWRAARETLARNAPAFDAIGMASIREVMAARCAAALGDPNAARAHLQAAAATAGGLAAHVRLVAFTDPWLRPLVAAHGVLH